MPNESRTTPLGLYHYAVSYWKSAEKLSKAKFAERVTHKDAPVTFLYYHAIELFLKSFLLKKGKGLDDLKKFRHNIKQLAALAQEFGFQFSEEGLEVIRLTVDYNNIMRSRYIETGAFRRATVEALERLCEDLNEAVMP